MFRKAEIQKFISLWKHLYDLLFNYIQSQSENTEDYQKLINYMDDQKIGDTKEQLSVFLHLTSNILNNYQQKNNFFDKFQKILLLYKDQIKHAFSNSEIFNFFRNDKKILLFLFHSQIIEVDDSIINIIFNDRYKKKFSYHLYFYPEIKSFVENPEIIEKELFEKDSKIFTIFEKRRNEGQNDSYLCELIRNDSIAEFVSYTNQTNLPISTTTIKPSLFETNTFLLKNNDTTILQYAAFFGAIQIILYLKTIEIEIKPSIWPYAIHSKSYELIHFLIENHIVPTNQTYEECLKESIKCHFNDIAEYIQENLLLTKQGEFESKFDKNIACYSFHYFNFFFFPDDFNQKFIFYYACRYDYFTLVKLLMSTAAFNIYPKIISNFLFFLIKLFQKKNLNKISLKKFE